MAQITLEGIKGGGGSIKLGTTGTIGTLMTRELDQISSAPQKHKHASSSRTKPSSSRTLPVSIACGSSTPKRLQPRKSSDEAGSSSSSGSSNITKYRTPPGKNTHKTKSSNGRNTHRIPILGADSFPVDHRSPAREKKNEKKVPHIVEVVDIKCGSTDKAWATPLTSRLKKLGFSKLSESII